MYLLATLNVLATFEYMLEQFSNKKKKAAKMFAKQKLQVPLIDLGTSTCHAADRTQY